MNTHRFIHVCMFFVFSLDKVFVSRIHMKRERRGGRRRTTTNKEIKARRLDKTRRRKRERVRK